MTAYELKFMNRDGRAVGLLRRAWEINRLTTIMVVVTALFSILAMVGIFADSRTVLGQPIWAKSTKFALSMAIYGATLLWIFSYITPRPRWIDRLLNATGVLLLLEMLIIIIQAVRGQMMHFNYSTPIDSTLYTVMAIAIYTLFLATFIGMVLLLRTKLPGRSFAWGLRLGVVVTVLAGYGVANLMTIPTATQRAAMAAGEDGAMGIIGAHTVGAEDGGPGLPLLGWSTTHGDLRPAHFFGMHALQIIPLLGLAVSRRRARWLGEGHRVALVVIGAVTYSGAVGLTAWQALRAEPLIYPSTTTLTALAGLFVAAALAVAATLLHSYRSHRLA